MAKRDDDDTGISGKRKKSWRELDAQRGKSKGASRHDDPGQQRIEQSPTYSKYKNAADALFTGAPLPEGLAKQLDPDGKRNAQKEAMMGLSDLGDRQRWVDGVIAYLEKYPELPTDAFFLDSLLAHPKERIAAKALAKLESLAEEGTLVKGKAPKSLEQRLKSIELTSMDSEDQARAKALRTQLF